MMDTSAIEANGVYKKKADDDNGKQRSDGWWALFFSIAMRQAIRTVVPETLDWGRPVFYMQATDGNLFDFV
jgi:hypothetical protein